MQSNRALKRWYRGINSRFFKGELPDNVCVRWMDETDLEEDEKCEDNYNGFCYAEKHGRHCAVIVLNTELKKDKGRLFHVKLNFRDDHGPAFERERLLLSDQGFFKKGMVLDGMTLF